MAQETYQGKVSRGGLHVHYRAYGTGAPVAILSGGPGFDCDYMEPLARELATTHRAVLVDLRGTGRSVPAAINHDSVNLTETLADLEAIREQIGARTWSVLGHSAGAVLAMTYAAAYPAGINSMVLVNSGPVRRESARAQMDNVMMHLTPQERDEMSKSDAQDFGALFKYLVPGYFYDRTHTAGLPPAFGPANFHSETANLLSADIFSGSGDLRPGLQHFAPPVLIIAGRQDPCDPGMQYEIHLALKNSALQLLERCGHFCWIEQPGEFYHAVRAFLNAHSGQVTAALP